MKRLASWPLGAVSLAIAGTVLLSLTPTMTPEFGFKPKTLTAKTALLSGEALDVDTHGSGVALEIGGSGVPIPTEADVLSAFENYLVPHGFGGFTPQALFTPEGLEPIDTGVKSLPLDTSVAQGVTILNNAIKAQLEAGQKVVVGGDSQSSTIISLEMRDIVNGSLGFKPSPDQLFFGMLGNPSNPNGGLLERFDLPEQSSHPSIPSLGITFSGATPADTGFSNIIYTLEYDGFADFPRYPINLLSDLNAVLGFDLVHPDYVAAHVAPGAGVTPEQIADAITLQTSEGYDGGTTYYMIPTAQLPLATIIQDIAGKPVADLLEPDLRVLVNLGYGADPSIGWSDTPANVPTPAGLFPSIDSGQLNTIVQALGSGAQQGLHNFMADVSNPASWAPTGASTASDTLDLASLPSFTDFVNAFSTAASNAYAALLPTADIINALTTTLPAEDISLFIGYLQAGDLLDAVGMPIAINTGLDAVAGGVEFAVLDRALESVEGAFNGI